MKDELFGGLGRTWLAAMVLWVLSTALFLFGKIDSSMWQQMVGMGLGIAGLKSAVVGFGNTKGK